MKGSVELSPSQQRILEVSAATIRADDPWGLVSASVGFFYEDGNILSKDRLHSDCKELRKIMDKRMPVAGDPVIQVIAKIVPLERHTEKIVDEITPHCLIFSRSREANL